MFVPCADARDDWCKLDGATRPCAMPVSGAARPKALALDQTVPPSIRARTYALQRCAQERTKPRGHASGVSSRATRQSSISGAAFLLFRRALTQPARSAGRWRRFAAFWLRSAVLACRPSPSLVHQTDALLRRSCSPCENSRAHWESAAAER
jgi:hypothetical protein